MATKIAATWTSDCQGKKDFDGEIVVISTRYWPRGGGFTEFNADTRQVRQNEDRPEIRPSAKSTILIRDHMDNDLEIVAKEFEADTEQEVKSQVEAWADEQFQKIIAAIKSAYTISEAR